MITAVNILTAGTTTVTYPMFVAENDGFIRQADFAATVSCDGTKTLTLRNSTTGVNYSNGITVNGVTILTRINMSLASTNAKFSKGDVISVVYTCTAAGTTAPGNVAITMAIDTAPYGGQAGGTGPAWAG